MYNIEAYYFCGLNYLGQERGEGMHKFLRSVGFSNYKNRRDIEILLDEMEDKAVSIRQIQIDEETTLCEIRGEAAPGMGVVMVGIMDEMNIFKREYYYPYLLNHELSSEMECTLQRHTEKETYAGLLDEFRVGISLIFYLENGFEYHKRRIEQFSRQIKSVNLTGLCNSGKILLPLHKTRKQIEKAQVAAKDRNTLLEAAKNGDEDAMETLTIEDIDMYSQISRRVLKEDIYSIVDSSFMPCGIECDQYSIIGEIVGVETKENQITGELVYDLALNCNDLKFHVGINKTDLLGAPRVGRRFKGQIWMQGTAIFD